METVEVVIKIPKEVYENIQKIDRIIVGRRNGKTIEFALWNGVKNGIVLPKNHGRLIDADETLKKHCVDLCKEKPSCHEDCLIYDLFHLAPTIIEVDKEVENDD